MIANEADTTMDNLKFLPTCNDSLIMVRPLIDADGAANWLDWRLWPASRSLRNFRSAVQSFRPTPGVATPWRGLHVRGLMARDCSQFLTVPNEGTSRAALGRVRVFEPGASREFHWCWAEHDV